MDNDIRIEDILEEHELALASSRILPAASDEADLFAERLRTRTRRSPIQLPQIDRLAPDNRRRLNTLVLLEHAMSTGDDLDHSPLMLLASQVIEDEFGRLLSTPSKNAAALLQRVTSDSSIASVLDRWFEGRLPMTLGTVQALCVGWRRAAEASEPGLELTSRFVTWVQTRGPERAISRVRDEFRNPAAHGQRTFGPDEFARFASLAVGSTSVGGWLVRGVAPPVPFDRALIHQYLETTRSD